MSIAGDVGKLLPRALPVLAAAVVATVLWPGAVAFLGRFRGIGLALGTAVLAVGVAFWISAVATLVRSHRADQLATGGAFRMVRHPIFAWWLVFVLPPVALVTDSWAFIVCSLILWFLLRPMMVREDEYLARRYPDEFPRYRLQTRAIVPLPKLRPFSVGALLWWIVPVGVGGVVALVAFFLVIRPVTLGLGTTKAERTAVLSGDRYIETVRSGYTQAITIDASPAEVWPWLVQVGHGRAGWYNFDVINRLADRNYFYEADGSAERIIPELQSVSLGDQINMVPQLGMTVVELIPQRRLLLVGQPDNPKASTNAVWQFELRSVPVTDSAGKAQSTSAGELNGSGQSEATRLVVRFSSTFTGGPVAAVLNGLVNEIGGAIIQQPAMLAGLRRRAEK